MEEEAYARWDKYIADWRKDFESYVKELRSLSCPAAVDIDKCLKKVAYELAIFEEGLYNMTSASDSSKKQKYEVGLKRQIKKLQRLREQLKPWLEAKDIRNKTTLVSAKALIETQMERFKYAERESKTKAYSNEGLMRQLQKVDPVVKEAEDISKWLRDVISKLDIQTDWMESEVEKLMQEKRKKVDIDKESRVEGLKTSMDRNKYHTEKIETILRMVNNKMGDDSIVLKAFLEKVNAIKDDIEYYLSSNQDPDFQANEYLFEDFDGLAEVMIMQQFESGIKVPLLSDFGRDLVNQMEESEFSLSGKDCGALLVSSKDDTTNTQPFTHVASTENTPKTGKTMLKTSIQQPLTRIFPTDGVGVGMTSVNSSVHSSSLYPKVGEPSKHRPFSIPQSVPYQPKYRDAFIMGEDLPHLTSMLGPTPSDYKAELSAPASFSPERRQFSQVPMQSRSSLGFMGVSQRHTELSQFTPIKLPYQMDIGFRKLEAVGGLSYTFPERGFNPAECMGHGFSQRYDVAPPLTLQQEAQNELAKPPPRLLYGRDLLVDHGLGGGYVYNFQEESIFVAARKLQLQVYGTSWTNNEQIDPEIDDGSQPDLGWGPMAVSSRNQKQKIANGFIPFHCNVGGSSINLERTSNFETSPTQRLEATGGSQRNLDRRLHFGISPAQRLEAVGGSNINMDRGSHYGISPNQRLEVTVGSQMNLNSRPHFEINTAQRLEAANRSQINLDRRLPLGSCPPPGLSRTLTRGLDFNQDRISSYGVNPGISEERAFTSRFALDTGTNFEAGVTSQQEISTLSSDFSNGYDSMGLQVGLDSILADFLSKQKANLETAPHVSPMQLTNPLRQAPLQEEQQEQLMRLEAAERVTPKSPATGDLRQYKGPTRNIITTSHYPET